MKKISNSLFIIILVLLIISCSNNKEKLLNYYQKNFEYLEKTQETDQNKKTEELEKILKNVGFKDQKEFSDAAIKYFDDTEIKKITEKIQVIESQIIEKKAADKQKQLEEQFKNQEIPSSDSILNMDLK